MRFPPVPVLSNRPPPGRSRFQLWYLIPIVGGVLTLTAIFGVILGNAVRDSMPEYSAAKMTSGMAAIKASYADQGIKIVWPYQGSKHSLEAIIPAQYSDPQMQAVMTALTREFGKVRRASGANPGGFIYLIDDAGRPRGDMRDEN